jgi:hypothetical protein
VGSARRNMPFATAGGREEVRIGCAQAIAGWRGVAAESRWHRSSESRSTGIARDVRAKGGPQPYGSTYLEIAHPLLGLT